MLARRTVQPCRGHDGAAMQRNIRCSQELVDEADAAAKAALDSDMEDD